jgi:preprotein translocase subunit YajC
VDNLLPILPLVGIAVLFWLILIRPAQRRQRALSQLQGHVTVGDEVMLTSGIFGTVRGMDDRTVSLEVSEGVTLKVVRAAVGSVETSTASAADADAELVDESEEKQ